MLRRRSLLSQGLVIGTGLTACGGGAPTSTPPPANSPRTWKMGFSGTPSRPDTASLLRGVDAWSPRAELAMIHEELPWSELLRGTPPEAILERDKLPLVQYYRAKGLQLAFMGELNDGMARQSEAPQLRQAGRHIAEPAVQQLYRDYMRAVARLLRPDYLGLAAETNLVRALAPAPLYAAVVKAANDCAAELLAIGFSAPLLCSVQVETAWGKFGGGDGYTGIGADLRDFPFIQILGLSSYPYFAWPQPEALPPDYYARLLASTALPAMVLEGGWTSASFSSVASSPETQARYLRVQAEMLDRIKARGLIQLLYADLDLPSWPPLLRDSLAPFAHIGLVDANFMPKPALVEWDRLHARSVG